MNTLFLSHHPHEAHLNFAKQINARIKIIPFNKYINLMKKYYFLNYFYPTVSLIYSFFTRIKSNVLVIDGGSSLYVAAFLKMRNRKLKIVYLDADLLFCNIIKSRKLPSFSLEFSLKMIDAVISISEKNKKYARQFLKIPIKVCSPYPKEVKKENIIRENYGLYIGRLDPDKNIKRVIDFGLQCPYFEKFIIIGGGVLEDYVKRISRKYKKIVYFGKRKNVAKYYSQCKFLIHIPDLDPHPCITMEAAMCGCYPIISKGVGTKYLFDKIFIIDNPNDSVEINKKIKFILDNENKTKKLLYTAIKKFPTKQESLKDFKNKFEKIIKQIKNEGQ